MLKVPPSLLLYLWQLQDFYCLYFLFSQTLLWLEWLSMDSFQLASLTCVLGIKFFHVFCSSPFPLPALGEHLRRTDVDSDLGFWFCPYEVTFQPLPWLSQLSHIPLPGCSTLCLSGHSPVGILVSSTSCQFRIKAVRNIHILTLVWVWDVSPQVNTKEHNCQVTWLDGIS